MRIDIDTKERYATKILDTTDEDAFFYPAFCQVKEAVTAFVREMSQQIVEENKDISRFQRNNIFSFCASRGQGKTSALFSFVDYLSNSEKEKLETFSEVKKAQFHALPSVDPTLLEEQDSILKTILSRMFHVLNEKEVEISEKSSNSMQYEQKKHSYYELLKKFSNCFESVDVIKRDQKSTFQEHQDNLDRLSQLGDSSNLKIQLYELVEAYMDVLYDTSSQQKFLVISLDDTDMNVKKTFDIIEDIRKYLILPNVIVLLATDLVQLEECVEQYFLCEFEHSMKIDQKRFYASCQRLTQSYMSKFLPSAHRIHLPDITATVKNPLADVTLCINGSEVTDYQVRLINLIQEKVGIYLVAPKGGLHTLLPKTFRNLYTLIILLEGLEKIQVPNRGDIAAGASIEMLRYLLFNEMKANVDNDDIKKVVFEKWKYNLKVFTDYLINDWSREHLSFEEKSAFQEICTMPVQSLKLGIVKKLHYLSGFPELDISSVKSLAETREMIEVYRSKTAIIDKKDKSHLCYGIQLFLTLTSVELLLQEWLGNLAKENMVFITLDAKKGLLAFTGGAEIPWRLIKNREPYTIFGGFELDFDLLKAEFEKIKNPEIKELLKISLRTSYKEENGIVFDPIHLQGISPQNHMDNPLEIINSISQDAYIELLLIILNWDLTKVLLDMLHSEYFAPDNDKISNLFSKSPSSNTKWRNLQEQQQYFYQSVASICLYTRNLPLSMVEEIIDSDGLVDAAIELSGLKTLNNAFPVWETVFLSHSWYKDKLKEQLEKDLKEIISKIDLDSLIDKNNNWNTENLPSAQKKLEGMRNLVTACLDESLKKHLLEYYGSRDFIETIIENQHFFSMYDRLLKSCLNVFDELGKFSKDDTNPNEALKKLRIEFDQLYNIFSENLLSVPYNIYV